MKEKMKISLNKQLQETLVHIDKFKDYNYSEYSDNIKTISIVADRGFGKTTFLKLLKNQLDNDKNLIVSDIIDPINLIKGPDNSYMITELVLYVVYKKIRENQNYNSNEILKSISALVEERNNMQKGYMSSEVTGLSILNKLETVFNFKKSIDLILDNTGKKLVLLFDDFDLVENDIISSILEELHEFIGTENIIFIFAYRERQLQNAVTSTTMLDNKILLEKGNLSNNDIYAQVNNKLIKMFPSMYKVYLPRIEEFYETEEEVTGKSKREYIINSLSEALNMRLEPARPIENINAILPQSPREYNHMKIFLSDIKHISNPTEQLESFEKYLIARIEESDINYYLKDLVENYLSVQMSEKNGVIINHVRNYVKSMERNKLNNSCDFTNERDITNASIADVIQTLNDLLDYDSSPELMSFVYSFKLLISIKLKLQTLLLSEEHDKNKKFSIYNEYINHINGYYMPMTKSYYGNMRDFSNINISTFSNEDVCREELEIAFLSLISLHNQGPKFTDNSGFMEFVAQLEEPKPFDVETGKGNLICRINKSRLNNLIKLYEMPLEYLNIKIEDFELKSNLEELLKQIMESNNINYRLSAMYMRFDPMNVFLRYDVMQNHIEKGYNKLIIDNIFDIDEMHEYNYYRQGEYYSVANVIKRHINRYYDDYVLNKGILSKYITLSDSEKVSSGKRLIELETKTSDSYKIKEICRKYEVSTRFVGSETRLNNHFNNLISELSEFKAASLNGRSLTRYVINQIRDKHMKLFGESRKHIARKIYDLKEHADMIHTKSNDIDETVF